MNDKPDVVLSEKFARSLTDPVLAPHGVEREAEYRQPETGEYIARSGRVVRYGAPGNMEWLVVTPRKPSLAQLVKDSGWRCDIVGAYEVRINSRTQDVWVCVGSGCRSSLVQLKRKWSPHLPFLGSFPFHMYAIKLDADGYPIVEGGDA